ncbi:hypothetical protein ACTA71_006723 [Dictyostelium dimigraforme]
MNIKYNAMKDPTFLEEYIYFLSRDDTLFNPTVIYKVPMYINETIGNPIFVINLNDTVPYKLYENYSLAHSIEGGLVLPGENFLIVRNPKCTYPNPNSRDYIVCDSLPNYDYSIFNSSTKMYKSITNQKLVYRNSYIDLNNNRIYIYKIDSHQIVSISIDNESDIIIHFINVDIDNIWINGNWLYFTNRNLIYKCKKGCINCILPDPIISIDFFNKSNNIESAISDSHFFYFSLKNGGLFKLPINGEISKLEKLGGSENFYTSLFINNNSTSLFFLLIESNFRSIKRINLNNRLIKTLFISENNYFPKF